MFHSMARFMVERAMVPIGPPRKQVRPCLAQHDAREFAHTLSLGADQYLAAKQVECLNAGGAFVQGGDACITGDLLHAVLVNVAVPAEHLHADIGGFEAHFGKKALEDGRVEAELVVVALRSWPDRFRAWR